MVVPCDPDVSFALNGIGEVIWNVIKRKLREGEITDSCPGAGVAGISGPTHTNQCSYHIRPLRRLDDRRADEMEHKRFEEFLMAKFSLICITENASGLL